MVGHTSKHSTKGSLTVTREIKYINAGDGGLTLTARISQDGTQLGGLVSMTESATLAGHYFADFPANPAGEYIIEIFNGSILIGDATELYWDGTQEVTLLTISNTLTTGSTENILDLILDNSRAANLQTQRAPE